MVKRKNTAKRHRQFLVLIGIEKGNQRYEAGDTAQLDDTWGLEALLSIGAIEPLKEKPYEQN